MVLDIIAQNYTIVLIVSGLFGLLLGIDRMFKKREEENKVLQGIGFLFGFILLIMPAIIILGINEDGVYSNYTLLLMFLVGLALLARPMKDLPLAVTLSVIVALGGFIGIAIFSGSNGAGDLPLTLVAIIMLIVVFAILIATIFIEKVLDAVLVVLGWGPLITIFSLTSIAQGVLILTHITNHYGLLQYLGFGQ